MNNLKIIPTIGLIGLGNQGKKLVKLVGLCDRSIEEFTKCWRSTFPKEDLRLNRF